MALPLPVPMDRGYLNLLNHLRQPKSSLSPETIQAATCHYLIHLPVAQPTPTPLTASVLASPLWHPLSLKPCLALGSTFRNAALLKSAELKKETRGLFDASASGDFASWADGVLAGLKNGDGLLRLSILGGLLSGMKDLKEIKIKHRLTREVEESIILAFAEITDSVPTSARDPWANEFKKTDGDEAERTELSVLLAAQYFNSISTEALSALNLMSLASSCLRLIEKGFKFGSYLATARGSFIQDSSGRLTLSESPELQGHLDSLLTSDNFTYVAPICRLLTRAVSTLSDMSLRPQRKKELWSLLSDVTQMVRNMSHRVESDWRSSALANVRAESQIDNKARAETERIWTLLKTQLFSTLMLHQSMLDTLLFLPLLPPTLQQNAQNSSSYITASILCTLSSLSFVIASFGGVTAGAANGGNGPSFPELKKAFYMAIDILSCDSSESEVFVRGLIREAGSTDHESGNPFVISKRSFALSSIEQFIPVLDDQCIEESVLPFCEPHLAIPSQRETFEAAHSVMLSIFAAHADKSPVVSHSHSLEGKGSGDIKGKGVLRTPEIGLARHLVPGYARSLLESAKEGGLTTPQLRLAFSALVRSASTGKHSQFNFTPTKPPSSPHSNILQAKHWLLHIGSNTNTNTEFTGDPALTWLCIEQLLHALSLSSKSQTQPDVDPQTHLALSLTLISLLSNVSLLLLPRVLSEVERVIDGEVDPARRRVLVENTFEEVLERVGDGEREIAMKWWFEQSKRWAVSVDSHISEAR